jgi:hypothetical protein
MKEIPITDVRRFTAVNIILFGSIIIFFLSLIIIPLRPLLVPSIVVLIIFIVLTLMRLFALKK